MAAHFVFGPILMVRPIRQAQGKQAHHKLCYLDSLKKFKSFKLHHLSRAESKDRIKAAIDSSESGFGQLDRCDKSWRERGFCSY